MTAAGVRGAKRTKPMSDAAVPLREAAPVGLGSPGNAAMSRTLVRAEMPITPHQAGVGNAAAKSAGTLAPPVPDAQAAASPGEAAAPLPEKRYNLRFEIPPQFMQKAEILPYDNQTEEEAVKRLYEFRQKLLDIIQNHRTYLHVPLKENRKSSEVL